MFDRRAQPYTPRLRRRAAAPTVPLILLLSALALIASGCDGVAPQPLYSLADARRPGGFFEHPYPSDLRRTPKGAPDLAGFPGLDTVPLLEELATVMRDASICGLGQAAPNPLISVLNYFPDDL